MHQRRLGSNGPLVSALGLGCAGMSECYGPGDDVESVRTLHRALDLGVTFLDTAATYGFGGNERLIGPVVRERRHEIFLATKCGISGGAAGTRSALDGSPAAIARSCDESLMRLGVDVIDLFYLHRLDPQVPVEESVGAMARLVDAGKVRYLGLSEAGPSALRRACAVHQITALQSEYSLWWREPEAQVIPACRELGIGFVPFSPLGRGILSGTLTSSDAFARGDVRLHLPRFQGDSFKQNLELVAELEKVAKVRACSSSQLALAWLLARGDDIVPIPGTKRRTHLESNVGATALALSADDIATLNATFTLTAGFGERYPPEFMKWVDR